MVAKFNTNIDNDDIITKFYNSHISTNFFNTTERDNSYISFCKQRDDVVRFLGWHGRVRPSTNVFVAHATTKCVIHLLLDFNQRIFSKLYLFLYTNLSNQEIYLEKQSVS